MEQGFLLETVRQNGLSENSLVSRVKADLAWVNFVGHSMTEQPKISKKKIAAERVRLKKELMTKLKLL